MPANVESMMYAREGGVPWHGLGTPVDTCPTWPEAIKAAGLDWTVSVQPLYVKRPTVDADSYQLVPDHFSVVRGDNKRILGVVGKRFTPIQNVDAFRFMDEVVGTNLLYETAASLNHGRTVFMLANLPESGVAVDEHGEDNLVNYLLLANSHDGTHSLTARLTTVRVVCQNTLSMALRGGGVSFRVRHTEEPARNIVACAGEAADLLGFACKQAATLAGYMRHLTQVKVTPEMLDHFITELLPPNAEGEVTAQTRNNRDTVRDWYRNGPGQDLPSAKGTAWGLLNAATGFATHLQTVRVQNGPEIVKAEGQAAYDRAKRDARVKSLLLGGNSSNFGLGALDLLQELVPVPAQA